MRNTKQVNSKISLITVGIELTTYSWSLIYYSNALPVELLGQDGSNMWHFGTQSSLMIHVCLYVYNKSKVVGNTSKIVVKLIFQLAQFQLYHHNVNSSISLIKSCAQWRIGFFPAWLKYKAWRKPARCLWRNIKYSTQFYGQTKQDKTE